MNYLTRIFAVVWIVLMALWSTSKIGEEPSGPVSWFSAWLFVGVNVYCMAIGYAVAKDVERSKT